MKNLRLQIIIFLFLYSPIALSKKEIQNTNKVSCFKNLVNNATKASARLNLYLAEFIASESAKNHLNQFRLGKHDGSPKIYTSESQQTKELFHGHYYQELTEHLVEEVANWYGNKIPANNALFMQGNTFRIFSPTDAFIEMLNGIDLADITGTFTYHIRATTKDGYIHFTGVNQMSLESYSGENYLRHGMVTNPDIGPLSSTTQVYKWKVIIPEKYRQ